jgi:hypothetical protein
MPCNVVKSCPYPPKVLIITSGHIYQHHRVQGLVFFAPKIAGSMSVILVVFYLFIGLGGCLMGPRISCGAYKLARTSWVKKRKRKEEGLVFFSFFDRVKSEE